VLLRHPGKLLSQQYLLKQVWGPGYAEAAGNLRLYMAQCAVNSSPTRPGLAGCSPSREWATGSSPTPGEAKPPPDRFLRILGGWFPGHGPHAGSGGYGGAEPPADAATVASW
jgi:hypothetical protein